MNTVQTLTKNQLDLLQDFSNSSSKVTLYRESTATEMYYDDYGRIRSKPSKEEYTKQIQYFHSKCYDEFNNNGDEYFTQSFFEMFRKCIVRKTCSADNYSKYVD